ncbi:DUF779 domain-containing protein [Echinicola sp. CAU 1574]|uniref:DUF779 domain-containing protein n=1 Tax=Echinicola arenosa TaxID=2774144 RepID=A0ABR9AKP7_9BACT|nr:DUF779 domain-containing protein [Echinicola arenosa]MBD8488164.1 DUF779 domain-containing protein [Echinicola arenosa]
MSFQRIDITNAAKELIDQLRADHGPLMFHQSGGCCDGSSPMCYAKGEFKTGASDVWMGNIHDCDFYMSKDQFEYWKHTHLTLDVTDGRGASFSLEIPYGKRFLIKSRMLTEEELGDLEPIQSGDNSS